jgi:hypothetical protein
MREKLGHDGTPMDYWRENLLSGEPLSECPLRTILRAHEAPATAALSREVDARLEHYPEYERGVLFRAGGIADQPARYLELMRRIDSMKNATEAKYLKLLEEKDEPGAP